MGGYATPAQPFLKGLEPDYFLMADIPTNPNEWPAHLQKLLFYRDHSDNVVYQNLMIAYYNRLADLWSAYYGQKKERIPFRGY